MIDYRWKFRASIKKAKTNRQDANVKRYLENAPLMTQLYCQSGLLSQNILIDQLKLKESKSDTHKFKRKET